MKRLGFLLIVLVALNSAAPAFAANWRVDRDCSSVEFSVRQMFVTHVRGSFNRVRGLIYIDEEDVRRSRVSVSIAAESLRAEREGLAAFLRGPRLFHASEFSEVIFQSKKVAESPKGGLTVVGELTIRGVTREVQLEIPKPGRAIHGGRHSERLRFTAVAKINRKQFGMIWSPILDRGGMMVGEEVNIRIHLELVRQDAYAEKKEGLTYCLQTEPTGG
jgi:polyisoprenoid-binding protein YceI